MDVVGSRGPSKAGCRGLLQEIPPAVQETVAAMLIPEYRFALDPSYRDMVQRSGRLSATCPTPLSLSRGRRAGFPSGEPVGRLLGLFAE